MCATVCADSPVPPPDLWTAADYVQPSRFTSPTAQSPLTGTTSGPVLANSGFGEFGFDDDADAVSTSRAFALSLLLPGMGQHYVGERGRARVFFAAEAAAWIAAGAFKRIHDVKVNDYRNLAVTRAGADINGKDDEFFRALNFYDSRDEYNGVGRIIRRNRPYWPDTEEWDWQWDSPASRLSYRSIRNQSEEASRRSQFAIGAAILNRLVSSLDAWRAARAVNRKARMELSRNNLKLRLKGTPFGDNPRVMLVIRQKL